MSVFRDLNQAAIQADLGKNAKSLTPYWKKPLVMAKNTANGAGTARINLYQYK